MNRKLVITIYYLMSARIFIDPMFGMFLPSTLLRVAELLVLMAILYCFIRLYYRNALCSYPFGLANLIAIYAIYSASIVLRGDFSGGMKELVFSLNGSMQVLPYLFPFIILFLPNRRYQKDILNVMFNSCLLAVPLWAINAGSLVQDLFKGESIGAYFPYFAAFLLSFLKSFPPHKRLAIVLVYLFYMLMMILNARRNVVASLALYGLVAMVSTFRWNIHSFMKYVLPSMLLLFAVILNFPALSDSLLKNFLGRIDEDTRSNVELLMLADFAGSPVTDSVFGRGMDGTYFHEGFAVEGEEMDNERIVVETGYLNFILKGGVVYLLLVVIVTVVAIVWGLRKSNAVPVCIPLLLMVFLLDFYMTTPISVFSVKLIIYWFIVSICFQKKVMYVRFK